MSQTPPNGPQVPGGQPQQPPVPQQPPMAQPPYQAPPQQAPQGYPQQGGYPTQGVPQPPAGYPQQQPAYPQQPYPGQPAYQGQQPAYQGQQPGYQGQQAFQGQQQTGYRPQGAYPGGYPGQPQPPAGRASSSKILLIVIGAVVLLVLAGGVLLMMSNRQTPTVDPVTPSPGPVPTASATTQPTVPTNTTDPTTAPTTEPTKEPTTEPTTSSGGVIDLGNGVMFLPADGWEVQEQVPGAVTVGNGEAVVVTRVLQAKKDTNPGQLCDAFNRKILEEAPGARFADPKDQQISLKNLGLASCAAAFVSSSNGKSQQMLVVTFAAVRKTDGLSTLTSMLYTTNTSDATFSDIDKMLGVVLTTQAAG